MLFENFLFIEPVRGETRLLNLSCRNSGVEFGWELEVLVG